MAVSTVSFNNTPQAGDDLFLSGGATGTGITEDTLSKIVCLNVMANDLGGAAKKLYSIDDGIENEGSATSADLLVKDLTGAISYSQGGARISITADGKISYDTGGWSPDFKTSLASLGAGESAFDTFTYAIQLGNGTLSWATVRVEIAGSNDAPTVSVADLCGAVKEEATLPNLSDTGTITFDDLDLTDTHTVDVTAGGANTLGGTLSAIVTTPATGDGAGTVTWTYSVANSLADHLAEGQTVTETFTIRISDNHGGYIDQVVSVKITGTNDGPTAVADVASGGENEVLTINVLANDTDIDDGHVLTLTTVSVDPGQGSVSIVGNQLRFDPGTDFDHLPSGESAKVTVSYTMQDEWGAQSNSTVTITVTGTNDAPIITSGDSGSVDENADTSTIVYQAIGYDKDDNDSITWSLGGADADAFNIDSSGNVTLKDPADFEAKPSYSIDVIATDEGNLIDSQAVTINVNDVNEAPTAVTLVNTTTAIDENVVVGGGIKVADITITDDALGTNTLSLSGADAASFSIVGAALYYTGASPNYESKKSYDVTVNVDDATVGASPDASQSFTLNINDVNEAPTAVSLVNTTTAIDENVVVGGGIKVADITITDDALGTNTLSLSGADAASFSIVGTALYYTGASPDYESKNSYAVTVNVNDATVGGTPDASQNFLLHINDVNEAPPADPNNFDTTDNLGNAITFGSSVVTTASGGSGNEKIIGTSDDNTIHGLSGNDAIFGGAGNDTIYGDDNNDALYGGSGNDTIYGGIGTDTIYGGSGNDTIYGDENNDTIYGGSGNDILDGKAGNDNVYGGYGDDTITVSDGDDNLIYLSKLDGNDVIAGFDADNAGGQDTINLDALFDTYGTMSGLRADHVSIVQSGADTLVRIDTDNSTGTFEMTITLTGVTAANVTVGADILVGS